jgi:hypothetical protein
MLAVQVEPGGVETSVHTRTLAIIGAMMTGDPETAEGRTLRVHMEPASYWEGGPSTPLLPEFQMETDIRGELSASSAPSHGSPLGELISEYGRDAVVPGFTLLVRLVWDCWTLQERSTGASVVQIAQVSVTAAAWPFGGIGLDLRVSPFLFWNDRLPPDVIEEREPWRDLVGCSELPQVRWSRWPQNPAVSPGRIGYIVMPLANSIQFSYKDRDLLAQLVTER